MYCINNSRRSYKYPFIALGDAPELAAPLGKCLVQIFVEDYCVDAHHHHAQATELAVQLRKKVGGAGKGKTCSETKASKTTGGGKGIKVIHDRREQSLLTAKKPREPARRRRTNIGRSLAA